MFIILGISIYKGNIELIHSYHQEDVTDKIGYGKAMGKSLILFSLPLIISGTIAFFTESLLPVIILIVGMIVGFIPIVKTQNKYNGGIF
ncbi:MAG: hypothetical protein IKJ86_04705 [Clostridia bacterium]|nr:hypothetical protein [Clostridia bacterium]